MTRFVEREELATILREHAENPSRLIYRRMPDTISRDTYMGLPPEQQAWFEPDESAVAMSPAKFGDDGPVTRTCVYMTYVKRDNEVEAWRIET